MKLLIFVLVTVVGAAWDEEFSDDGSNKYNEPEPDTEQLPLAVVNKSEPNTEEPQSAIVNKHSESEPELALIVLPAIMQINIFNEIPVNEPERNILTPQYRPQQYRNERPQPYDYSFTNEKQSHQSRYSPTKPPRSYKKVPAMGNQPKPYSSEMYNERSQPYGSMYN